MHSIILHFMESEKVILDKALSIGIVQGNCVSKDGGAFLFWLYEDYDSEYSKEEKINLEELLSGKPVCSFQLLARYHIANFALFKVIDLLKLSFGVMDDDIDNLWTLNQIIDHSKKNEFPTIYNIQENQR